MPRPASTLSSTRRRFAPRLRDRHGGLDEEDRSHHQAVQAGRRQGGADGARHHRHDGDRSAGLRPSEGAHRAVSRIGVHHRFPPQGEGGVGGARHPRGEGCGDGSRGGAHGLHRRRQGLRAPYGGSHPYPHRREGGIRHLTPPSPATVEAMADLLAASPRDRSALAELKRRGFPDPDMALNNLERLAAQGDRPALFRLLAGHPGALHLVARLGGTSQFLADTLRRRPTLLSWLVEPSTMRQWLGDELAADLEQSAHAFDRAEGRWNALRRFKYRQLLRIGSRDILGDADLTVTTEELSRMADVCLAAAWRWTEEELRRRYGEPRAADGTPTGFAVIGMGKLGGDELNYSSDIDLVFVYGDDGDTSGGEEGVIANGDYFATGARTLVEALESVTDEGYAFRVDLRLRPEGRMGGVVLSLSGYRAYLEERAELWERQALIKARFCAGDA